MDVVVVVAVVVVVVGISNCVGSMTTHANPHGAATTWVVLANA